MTQLIVITGDIGVGKTTFLSRLASLSRRSWSVDGFECLADDRDRSKGHSSASYSLRLFDSSGLLPWAAKNESGKGFSLCEKTKELVEKKLTDSQSEILILDEEQQIMSEQDQDAPSFSFDKFDEPISNMTLHKPITVKENEIIKDVVGLLVDNQIGSVLVVDKDGEVTGIVTERDVMMKLALSSEMADKPITAIMTEEPLCLHKDDEIAYVLNNMHVGGYRHIPIVDEHNKPLSVVSIRCVMDYIIDNFPQRVLNMVGEPYRGPSQRDGA
jgi:CBS domain-containing protein